MAKPKRTAVVFVHGQGEQAPMDDVLRLAFSVWETEPKAAGARLATDPKALGRLVSAPLQKQESEDLRCVTTEVVDGRQVHFHQFYWAPLMEGNSTWDVIRWLPGLLARPFGEVPDALKRARAILYLAIWLLWVLALLVCGLLAARLVSPPWGYAAWVGNTYAVIWGGAAAVLLWEACKFIPCVKGSAAVGRFFGFSLSVIPVAFAFSFFMGSIVPGTERFLKAFPLEEVSAPRITVMLQQIACGADANPTRTVFRDFCRASQCARGPIFPPASACPAKPAGKGELTQDRRVLESAVKGLSISRIADGGMQPEGVPTWWHLVSALHTGLLSAAIGLIALLAIWAGSLPRFLRNTMADSARYFSNDPANAAQRDRIRKAGAELLRRLHEQEDYERIIVLAHSLGSVVAYGMIDHYWGQLRGALDCGDRRGEAAGQAVAGRLAAVEAAAGALGQGSADDQRKALTAFRIAQTAYREALTEHCGVWRISDFVTIGSPLTYGKLLMAGSEAEFEAKVKKHHRFPTCPPTPNGDPGFSGGWIAEATNGEDCTPWHSAAFAAVRWTNLFITSNGLAKGDVIGGPVAETFGGGVLDIALDRKDVGGGFLHSAYWVTPGQEHATWAPAGVQTDSSPKAHILRLRQALNLFQDPRVDAHLVDKTFVPAGSRKPWYRDLDSR